MSGRRQSRVPETARALGQRVRRTWRELGKFGAVGAVGFVVNVVVFNLCMHTFALAPIRSGVISQVVAIVTNYLGNRYWTYLDTDKHRVRNETLLFFVFSGIALVLENSVLAFSHYGLGYTSTLADNVAKNGFGLALGTVFRFWSYRTWVFKPEPALATAGEGPSGATAAGTGNGTVVASGSGRRRSGRLAAKKKGEDRRMLLK